DEGAALGAGEVVQIFDVLLERASRDPRGHALDSALELAARKPELVGRLAEALDALPAASVPLQLPPKLVAAIVPRPAELTALLGRGRFDVVRALVDLIAGAGSDLEGQAARAAALDVIDELFGDAENYDELAALDLDAEGVLRALEAFIAYFIYNRLLVQIDE